MGDGGSRAAGRRALGWVLAAVVLWLAADATALRTSVTIHADGERVVLESRGTRLTADLPVQRVEALRVTATSSVDPPRRFELEAWQGDVLALRLRLPASELLRPPTPHPVGDWHVDRRLPRGTLAELPVELTAPCTVRLTARGRSFEAVTVVLDGRTPLQANLRRGLINDDLSWGAPGAVYPSASMPVPPRPYPRLAGVASTLLRGLAGAAALLAVAWLGAAVRRRWGAPRMPLPVVGPRGWWIAVGGLAAVATARSAWVAGVILDRVPHTPDAVAYLLQARWLLAGRLTAPAPPTPEWFDVPFTFVRNGVWFSQYPPAWPAVLAVGDLAGAPWLVAPVLGGLFVALVALLGRELYRPWIGLLAAAFAVVSPMATLMFASHLSHAAAAPLAAAFLWLAVASGARRAPWLAGPAGVALGLAFGMRPLTAVAVAAPVGLLLAAGLLLRRREALAGTRLAWMVAGGLLGTAPSLAANAAVTGSPFRFAYTLQDGGGFYGPDQVVLGLRNLDVVVASIPTQLLGAGWNLLPPLAVTALGLALVAVPLLRPRPARADLLMAGVWLAVALAYVGTGWTGLHGYGPRYHFEAFAALYVLAAAGVARLAAVESGGSCAAGARRPPPVVTAVVGTMLLAAAVALPARMGRYEDYNLVDGRLVSAVARLGLDRALVVLRSPHWYDWGRAAPLLASDPVGAELVFVSPPAGRRAALEAYPDRPAYVFTGDELVPVDPVAASGPAGR